MASYQQNLAVGADPMETRNLKYMLAFFEMYAYRQQLVADKRSQGYVQQLVADKEGVGPHPEFTNKIGRFWG